MRFYTFQFGIVLFIHLLFPVLCFASRQLGYTNFEDDGWQSMFTGESTWGTKVLRVTSNVHNGSYSLRGNQKEGVTDPLGAVGKGNLLLDWRGNGDIVPKTPNEMYFSYWFRHDDYNWNDSGDGKLLYFVDPKYSIRAMYYAQQLQQGRDTIRITYSNGGYSDDWARLPENWGGTSLQLGNSNISGEMGRWRHFEYYINYDQHYFMQWIDGYLLTPTNGKYPDGKIAFDPNLDIHWQGFQLFYADSRDVGSSTDGSTGYAAGWQIDDLEVWDGMPSARGALSPRLSFTSPTTESNYTQELTEPTQQLTISGTATDDKAIQSVTYSTDNGQSGTATSADGFKTWSVPITVNKNETVITTITATDDSGQSTSKTMTITCTCPVAWDATVQTGDSTWADSRVTYCVRLLVQGDSVTDSASQVVLGFKGRSIGDYTIRNVSIAQRDPAGGTGDVLDETWRKVTFDGAAWGNTVTVSSGSEKYSDPVRLDLQPGTDYYVTFKIDSPSVYLDPPADYEELYFTSEDHTSDIDWSGNGHSVTRDYHALSKIYTYSPAGSILPPASFQLK